MAHLLLGVVHVTGSHELYQSWDLQTFVALFILVNRRQLRQSIENMHRVLKTTPLPVAAYAVPLAVFATELLTTLALEVAHVYLVVIPRMQNCTDDASAEPHCYFNIAHNFWWAARVCANAMCAGTCISS
jgi:hypothetical protein